MTQRVKTVVLVLAISVLGAAPALAAPVTWVDWTAGTAGGAGHADGVLDLSVDVNVDYDGEIAFIQTAGGTNYWIPSASYISPLVDNAPPNPDIIALSSATSKTLTFSQPIDNLFFAVVSLNGNGYRFNQDFEVVSFGCGFWGCGTLTKVDLGGGLFDLIGAGEPHGVIRFTGSVSSISWTSLTNEFWNGFTIGTYGLADPDPDPDPVPEPASMLLLGSGIAAGAFRRWRAHR